jgi:hypothetical protein
MAKQTKSFGVTVAYIRWVDSAIFSGGEIKPEEVDGCCTLESCGILIRENKKEVVIALDRHTDTGELRLVLCVPRINISVMRKVRV